MEQRSNLGSSAGIPLSASHFRRIQRGELKRDYMNFGSFKSLRCGLGNKHIFSVQLVQASIHDMMLVGRVCVNPGTKRKLRLDSVNKMNYSREAQLKILTIQLFSQTIYLSFNNNNNHLLIMR